MNRHERRAAKKGNVTFIEYGHLLARDQNFGLPVTCYVCATPHKALGLARIQHKQTITNVPLCESRLGAGDRYNAVFRKFLNAPELEIIEGGEATTEQVLAAAEKQEATEH
jgi:hypothetical protein